jgi:DNA-directed DNA polymerase III PolC
MPAVPLLVHSFHSLLRGVPSIPELVTRAREQGHKALALTDVNSMAGSILFLQECRQLGIKPILGVELADARDPSLRVILLARNATGYGDLCELTTSFCLSRNGPNLVDVFRVPFPDLFALCPHPQLLQALAGTAIRPCLFGAISLTDEAAAARTRAVKALCKAEGLRAAVTHDCWFLDPADHELHHLLRAIDQNTDLSRVNPDQVASPASHLLPPLGLRAVYSAHLVALENAAKIADACTDDLQASPWILPKVDVPAGHTDESWLGHLAQEGLRENYGSKPEFSQAQALQAKELEVINRMGYAGYFLMVRRIREAAGARFASGFRGGRECSLLRGSAANCLTLYNLGASDLDPIRYGLYFERFLNEDRTSPPDADLDFGWDERPQVLQWFFDTYGEDHVCILSATHHFRRRAAFRETAKVLGFSEHQVSDVFRRLRQAPYRPGVHWLDRVHEVDPGLEKVARLAARVQGRPHFLGQHPGGVLVTNDPIWRHVSCQRSGGGTNRIISHIDMHGGIDFLGLIKFDILGNGSLSVLRDGLEMMREAGVADPEMDDLDPILEDPEILAMMASGATRGVFYLESPAQMRLNQKVGASSFEEIGITSSLIRPAGTAFAQTFIDRHRQAKAGKEEWEWLHPSLKPILEGSHDVCVFQEDITRICVEVAGLSFKDADKIRKMMNSSKEGMPSGFVELESRFISGCIDHQGMSLEQAQELWHRVDSFREFSFCQSHSLSYAQLSFRCAWLKKNHPAMFWAAVIGNDHGFYPTAAYVDEARRAGIHWLPWDINLSRWRHHGGDGWIRAGFQHVRGLHKASIEALEEERRQRPFGSLPDFRKRCPAVGRAELELLIRVGALDTFGLCRTWNLAWLAELAVSKGRTDTMSDLFQGGEFPPHLRGIPQESATSRALDELRLAGFTVAGDTFAPVQALAEKLSGIPATRLPEFAGKQVALVGIAIATRVHRVARTGDPMMFLSLSDHTGIADVVLWPETYKKFHAIATGGGILSIQGKVIEEDGTFSLEAVALKMA